MKIILTLFTVIAAIIIFCSTNPSSIHGLSTINLNNSVNPVIGDLSFIVEFGKRPDHSANEQLRLKTHLSFVEKILRNKNVSHLSKEQLKNRNRMLDLLHEYRVAGIFPMNYDYPGKRVPCFIDKSGRICAVGYLVEKTAGRDVAEKINSKFKYEELLAMNDRVLDEWIAFSGLTKEECAMIQPSYGYPGPTIDPNTSYLDPMESFATGILTGVNGGVSLVNILNSSKGKYSRFSTTFSIITGIGQLGLGAYQLSNQVWSSDYTAMKTLGIINVTMGAATAFIGSWSYFTRRENKRSLTWNIYSVPVDRSNLGLGLTMRKSF
jgi:hypothetical protein